MNTRTTIGSISLAVTLTVPIMLGGCAPDVRTTSPVAASAVASRTVAPGISEWGDGQVEAAGYVTWVDLEGGFWALHDRVSKSAATDRPKVVAVLLPGTVSEESIAALEGAYVAASGPMQGGASIRMAGPEVVVNKIAVARPGATR